MNFINSNESSCIEPKIIEREKRMVDVMILIYCKDHHGYENAPCYNCFKIGLYAKNRLENCRYQEKNLFVADVV